MKIEIGTGEREGFMDKILIRFSNGLTFSTTGSLIGGGSENRKKVLEKMIECVAELESLGVNFDGKDKLS